MCFPVSCIKYVLSFFAIITCIIGLAGIIFGSVELGKQGGHLDFDSFNPTSISTALLLGTGVIALLVGIVGLIGAKKKSRCCLCIYQFSVFPMVLLSLAVASLATYATYMVGDMAEVQDELNACDWRKPTEDCAKCGNDGMLEWVQTINTNAYILTNDILGKVDGCTILAGSDEDQAQYEAWGYTATQEEGAGVVNSALDCKNHITGPQKSSGQFLAYFEKEFKCSGMCTKTPFFAFYETNLPIEMDRQSCYAKIVNSLDSDVVTGVAWGIFAYFSLNLILACCLCCHPDRKQEKSGEALYQRMNYYD